MSEEDMSFEEAMKCIDEAINADWSDSSLCDIDMAREEIASLVIKHWKAIKEKLQI